MGGQYYNKLVITLTVGNSWNDVVKALRDFDKALDHTEVSITKTGMGRVIVDLMENYDD